jgi:AcrR family transcriptional regulator
VTSSRDRQPVAKGEAQAQEPQGIPRLPPGRHGLPRDFVVQNQRDRIAAGIIAAVSEFGYHETTITQIAAAAGVSRRTFYSYFDSKEECFLATFDQITDHLREAAREAAAGQAEWPAQVAAKLGSALEIFSTNPQLAGFALAVPPRAGSEVTAHYRRAIDRALEVLTEGIPSDGSVQLPPAAVQQSLIGGAVSLIAQKFEAGEGDRLRDLRPDLVELFLTPYIGRTRAVLAAGAA